MVRRTTAEKRADDEQKGTRPTKYDLYGETAATRGLRRNPGGNYVVSRKRVDFVLEARNERGSTTFIDFWLPADEPMNQSSAAFAPASRALVAPNAANTPFSHQTRSRHEVMLYFHKKRVDVSFFPLSRVIRLKRSKKPTNNVYPFKVLQFCEADPTVETTGWLVGRWVGKANPFTTL